MSPSPSDLRNAALEAMALFLRTSGFLVPAKAVDAARHQLSEESNPEWDDGKSFAAELKELAALLGRLGSTWEANLDRKARRGEGSSQSESGSEPAEVRSRPAFASLVARPSLQLAQADLVPSPHYVPPPSANQAGGAVMNFDPGVPEQYRDDHDPGFRIQEVSDAGSALSGLRGREDAAPVVAFAAPGVPDDEVRKISSACLCGSLGTSTAAVDDDELFNANGGGAAPLRHPITPRSFSGLVKDAGTAMLAALGVGAVDSQTARMNAAGNAVRRRVGEAAVTQTSLHAAHAGLQVARASPHGHRVTEGAVPAALVASQALGGAGDVPTFGTPDAVKSPAQVAEKDSHAYDSFSLRVVYERGRTGFEESKEFPLKIDGTIAARFKVQGYLGSTAFSTAVKCLDMQTNKLVCMKVIKNDKDIFDQSLDEIKLLRLTNAETESVDKKHCLALIDYFYFKEHLIIVTELLRENLYEFSKFNREHGDPPYFTLGRIQRLTRQVLIALEYLHSLSLIHADVKPENILLKSHSQCEVKLIDFGSSCFLGDYLTSYVQSRSYRAPEVVLGLPYDQKIDLWSLGCVVAELWTGYMLFQNDSIQSLLARMVSIVGSFPEHMLASGKLVSKYFTWDGRIYQSLESKMEASALPQRRMILYLPKRSSIRQRMRTDDGLFIDFLSCLLKLDPTERPTASQALQHPWLAPGRYSDGIRILHERDST